MTSMTAPLPEVSSQMTSTEQADPDRAVDGTDRAKILARLRRMEGQVRGVHKMVEEDQYCVDILTQISAITSAARNVGLLVLEDHIRNCVMGTCRHGRHDDQELLDELSAAIERFTRSVS
jgi:DNA-binding FrmR family transcriptional regulator